MAPAKRKYGKGGGRKSGATPALRTDSGQTQQRANFPRGDYETVDPIWLLKAGGLTLAIAALLAYASLCVYIYVGAWRTLLRPETAIAHTPAEAYTPVRFDAAESGTPRLTGWWIPASANAETAPTLLFLHGGDGSLGNSAAELDELHQAGVNLFAIDYRGYGQSGGPHPTEQRMMEDSSAALNYLMDTRHLAAGQIIPYGTGLGAVFAVRLAQEHGRLPAVGIDNPWPNAAEHVIHDPKYRWLPISLLLGDRFDLETPLNALEKPKLLISGGPGAAGSRHPISAIKVDTYDTSARLDAYFRTVTDPKMIVSLTKAHPRQTGPASPGVGVGVGKGGNDVRLSQTLTRFLGMYLPGMQAPVNR